MRYSSNSNEVVIALTRDEAMALRLAMESDGTQKVVSDLYCTLDDALEETQVFSRPVAETTEFPKTSSVVVGMAELEGQGASK